MTASPVNAVLKVCVCGRHYDAEAWATLPHVGYTGRASKTDVRCLEHRLCRGCAAVLSLSVAMPERVAA